MRRFEFDKQWIDFGKLKAPGMDNFALQTYRSMIIKIISGLLILFSAFMGVRHGINGLNLKPGDTGPIANFQKKINLGEGTLKAFAVLTILGALLLVPPQTFLAGNLLNMGLFLFLIIRFLMIGDPKAALSEVPFLLIPVVLLLLKHPFAIK